MIFYYFLKSLTFSTRGNKIRRYNFIGNIEESFHSVIFLIYMRMDPFSPEILFGPFGRYNSVFNLPKHQLIYHSNSQKCRNQLILLIYFMKLIKYLQAIILNLYVLTKIILNVTQIGYQFKKYLLAWMNMPYYNCWQRNKFKYCYCFKSIYQLHKRLFLQSS